MAVSDSIEQTQIVRFDKSGSRQIPDQLVVEEPLEIQIAYGPPGKRNRQALAVTMRTPGCDRELAIGFLHSEGIIGAAADVLETRWNTDLQNSLTIELHPRLAFNPAQLNRHFYTSSSCGVCGKASLDLVAANICHLLRPLQPQVPASILYPLADALRSQQHLFQSTGGLHAAGLFTPEGQLEILCEDVGRHNALDKLIGTALLQNRIPAHNSLLLLSGRIGFELVQKALMAGIPVLAAVGAPSSLALNLADEHGMTLIGFLRPNSFNVYCGAGRIV